MQISIENTAIILGNGPSLRGFDFISELGGLATFGLNVAYRYWDMIRWYPTYYACLDIGVGECHKKEILRLVQERISNGIKKFLLRHSIVRYLQKNGVSSADVISYDFWQLRNKFSGFFKDIILTTGALATLWAISLEYKNIILLGMDANFPIDVLPESKKCDDIMLKEESVYRSTLFRIEKTPERNDNYFFDGYQQKGDFYYMTDKARLTETQMHIKSWEFLPDVIDEIGDIKIINANPDSKIELFPKIPWSDAKKFLGVS